MTEQDTPHLMVRPLPEPSALRTVLEQLGAQIPEQLVPAGHPAASKAEAAHLLGVLEGLVEQMKVALHGGPLHVDLQNGYITAYERDVPALFAALAEQCKYDGAFTHAGMDQVPYATLQLSTAAAGLDTAWKAMAAAAILASGGPRRRGLTAEDARLVNVWTQEAQEALEAGHDRLKNSGQVAAEDDQR